MQVLSSTNIFLVTLTLVLPFSIVVVHFFDLGLEDVSPLPSPGSRYPPTATNNPLRDIYLSFLPLTLTHEPLTFELANDLVAYNIWIFVLFSTLSLAFWCTTRKLIGLFVNASGAKVVITVYPMMWVWFQF